MNFFENLPHFWACNVWYHSLGVAFFGQINTHYIHSVVVQDLVSGRACCVNQYHYESRVVMRFVHTTGKTWYKVLCHHTMYVISLSNISIKTNNKGWNNINKFVQHWGRLHFVHDVTFICFRSFYCFVNVTHIDVFYPAFQYDIITK